MRRTLATALLGIAAAAALAPLPSASAICWDTYYELTGTCTPCHTAGHALRAVEDRVDRELATVHCVQ